MESIFNMKVYFLNSQNKYREIGQFNNKTELFNIIESFLMLQLKAESPLLQVWDGQPKIIYKMCIKLLQTYTCCDILILWKIIGLDMNLMLSLIHSME